MTLSEHINAQLDHRKRDPLSFLPGWISSLQSNYQEAQRHAIANIERELADAVELMRCSRLLDDVILDAVKEGVRCGLKIAHHVMVYEVFSRPGHEAIADLMAESKIASLVDDVLALRRNEEAPA